VVPLAYRTNANGELDATHGENGVFSKAVLELVTEVYSAVLQGDSIVTVGYGRNTKQENLDFLSPRIKSDGTMDSTYGTNGQDRIDASGFKDNGRSMTALPDGRRFSSAVVAPQLRCQTAW